MRRLCFLTSIIVGSALVVSPRTPRLWLGDSVEQAPAELSAEQVQYLSRVMRLREGDVVRVFGRKMGEWAATLRFEGKRRAWITPREQIRSPPEVEVPLELWFAPLRKKRASLLVEKAVELGVTSLRAVRTEYTEKASIAALGSLGAVAVQAAEQSERLDVPTLSPLVTLADLNSDVPLVACVERCEETPHLLTVIQEEERRHRRGCGVVIGPEGGFSTKDLDLLKQKNATIASLGPGILRAETAAFAALAIMSAVRCTTS